ncbi:MAG: ribosomal protein S18-alanine N-acetyltransferase [Peptococcaceae bacterium]|nr:ribosomal protein S18-alanine N-acetyltransferase [Peptococcaceae bacterium]
MRADHINMVAEIERLSFANPWPVQTLEFELFYNELAHYVVAVVDGKVVGYGGFWMVLDDAHVTNVAVHPDYRGKGLGRRLMLEIMRRARELGALRMTLEVRPSNTIARKMYNDLGFVERGRRPRYYQNNQEDAIIMWKDDLRAFQ